MRFRKVYIGLGALFVILISLITDPSTGIVHDLPFGAGTVATIVILLKGILYAGLLHFTRKGLMDYFDFEVAMNKAMQTSEGAGKAMIAAAIYTVAMAIVIYAATVS